MPELEHSPSLKILRRIVIIMGFMLIIGIMALFIAVYYKFTHKTASPTNSYAAIAPLPQIPPEKKCIFAANNTLEINSNVISSVLNGNILTLITAAKTTPPVINKIQTGNALTLTATTAHLTQEVIVYDLCEGVVLSRLNVVMAN